MLKRVNLISDSAQKLKDFGHLEFLQWEKEYLCSEFLYNLDDLDKEIKELERVLVGWIFNVWSCRYQFPELNYYTTEQIIILRKELTPIIRDSSSKVNPQVFYLLHSVIGEPVNSVMLIKRGLKCDDMHSSTKIDEEDGDELLSQSIDITSLSDKEDESSLHNQDKNSIFQEAINKLNETKAKLFHELKSYDYDDYLCLEAAKNYDDVYNAMDWCDEVDDEQKQNLQKQWIPLNTASTSTSSLSVSDDHLLAVAMHSEQKTRLTKVSSHFSSFDVTPIVSSFVSSEVHES